ncbi:UDP-N-acetylmuramoyl-L-alanyl-D-glutamate--2,6-diaminopimelate ligase [Paenibacillus baekrokdamisoli]|uniref:UDP-N-acetylmuramoyl-L-alanyl-D-glutamate--2,6-diaminopimelate ligase n=1 Tax=Paenibacillus baekrokdamisoli TaxID=1712516 RepID=A0A3G9JIQ5_9BACL|nr:UDP-N-acetylmuramoyl-L-alanyl-D-glutamate--2,6-diaminopimelate ligase [Paenibacillus baekrokdamisoli]MBB3072280.1 UDP-N-acetylmuramoyl-L-alanyl-D-glutamate--2,6-diaminopimelate ligase [Paenibacillus baekrokdamisoli]BBH24863.1 UDP-N-acetylmuramoyl-L-alanyl-D-glutamate--2,6-diaminopimelate ligase [Paenibacillus baekrokdamisoli]
MKLKELINQLTISHVNGDTDVEISGININSQHLKPGELFVCIPGIPGFQEDRHKFIDEAIKAGAAALVLERDVYVDVPTVKVSDARYALAVLSAHFYGYPSLDLKLIGVTGTNGKTTTSYMIESIFAQAGYRTGLMGNIGTKIGSTMFETDINTQDPNRLQSNLSKMKENSTDFCVMEVTSQGLHMGRVLGCEFRTAVFTNLTQDHLNYHGTMESYLAAKGLLFSRMGNSFSADPSKRKFAVLNADDEASKYLKSVTGAQVVTYGINNLADVMAKDIQLTSKGTKFNLLSFAGKTSIELKMIGKFNVYNALAAISAALVEQVPLDVIQQGVAELVSVSGRMEVVDKGQDFLVLADYAHTPDGLDKALSTLRDFAEKKIVTVFGCGGDRDRTKRPIMGELAAKYSDFVIITSDNPRTEDPNGILKDIQRGLIDSQAPVDSYELIVDRRQAINRAIEVASSGDIVIIAGKGHETYQILKDETIHFDDREEAREAIRKKNL